MRGQVTDVLLLYEWDMLPEIKLIVLMYAGLVRVSQRKKLIEWTIYW